MKVCLTPTFIIEPKITAGDRYNVISGEAHLEGTIRYFSEEIGKDLKETLVHVAKTTAEAYGATAEVTFRQMGATLTNDAKLAQVGQRAVTKLLGEATLAPMEKTMVPWAMRWPKGCVFMNSASM